MSIILPIINGLLACNVHMSVYAAFGAILLVRAFVALRNRRHEAAREDAVIGLVHIVLSLL